MKDSSKITFYHSVTIGTYIKLKELIGSTNIANHTFISRKNKLCEIRSAIRSFDEEVNGVLNFVLQLVNIVLFLQRTLVRYSLLTLSTHNNIIL